MSLFRTFFAGIVRTVTSQPATLMMAVLIEHAGDWQAEAKAFTKRLRDQLLPSVPDVGPGGG